MQQLAKQTRYHKIILICKTIAGVNNNDNQTGNSNLAATAILHVMWQWQWHPTIKARSLDAVAHA